MNYFFHPEAKKEFLDAVDYYESCSEGLGLEFANDVYATIQRILHYPIIPMLGLCFQKIREGV